MYATREHILKRTLNQILITHLDIFYIRRFGNLYKLLILIPSYSLFHSPGMNSELSMLTDTPTLPSRVNAGHTMQILDAQKGQFRPLSADHWRFLVT
ncbi:hypothetical protein GDO78_013007 [Eleutherodactylus coqui]|uniref:Uncharacterized protein n=1 Tax=Eleutherodactylus coqui TaxID=57060 RepID=A0A8J6K3U7_ELECQ|nr:hypothetical protein GDO78_013007 [Eleutherodactylus coqui]